MKILHTSDLHLESPLTAHLSSDKVRERRAELFSSFSTLIDEAHRLGVRAFIIAGDLFDTERITKTARRRILSLIEGNSAISFFYLPGNHELDALTRGGERLPDNLFVFGEEWTYFSSGELVIAGRTETSPDMFETLSLAEDRKNVVVLHGELRERSDRGGVIGRRDAAGRGIDYLALGHYHSYSAEKIDERCTAVYCGTPEGRGFDELGEKGYSLAVSDHLGISHSFIRSAKRLLIEAEVDITGEDSTYSVECAVSAALVGVRPSDLVRVVLTGERRIDFRPDTAALSARFGDRYYCFEIKDKTRLRLSASDYEKDKTLKGEFIRLVMSKDEISAADKEEIIACGLTALYREGEL
ncbi:MAG: metallophosphoesterase [Clostridia bacterium]|nr:metallophosphoesterase [Clostridia bacterium]